MQRYRITGTATVEVLRTEDRPIDMTVESDDGVTARFEVEDAFYDTLDMDNEDVVAWDLSVSLISPPVLSNGYRPYASLPVQPPTTSTPTVSRTLANGYRPYAGC